VIYAAFCTDPLNPRRVDPEYKSEAECARAIGFEVILIDHDELDHRIVADAALKPARIIDSGSFIYRGWMLRAEAYNQLHLALKERHVNPLVSPEHYVTTHHAPNSASSLKEFTPETKFILLDDLDDESKISEVLGSFAGRGIVIKDWVKSQASGYWTEACYIPDSSDRAHSNKVIAKFRELQGDSIVGGIVFKEYVPLLPIGFPAHEYRAFVVNGKVVGCWPRSSEASQIHRPPHELLDRIASCIESPFASLDLSIDENGKWWLLEIGDGQVSSLPAPEAATAIFTALFEALSK